MPCSIAWDEDDDIKEARKKAEFATRAACDLYQVLRLGGQIMDLSPETKRWIQAHEEEDRRRAVELAEQAERDYQRRKALGKLTPDERRILGI